MKSSSIWERWPSLKKYQKTALHYFSKAIEIDDNREEYHAAIASVYAQLGELELAEAHFNNATEIAPEDTRYWKQYVLFLLETGQHEAAIDTLDIAEESAVGAELIYCRVASLFVAGARQEALLLLSEALEDEYESHSMLFEIVPSLQQDYEVLSMLKAFS